MNIAREPVAVTNAILGIIQALLGLLVAFGIWKLTAEQIAAIMTISAAVFTLVNVLIVRPQVTPLIDPRDAQNRSLRPVVP
jgi:uncharacterized membrane protein YkgB